MIRTAVILAAGAGSRLGRLGERYSKPMVPILRRPLVDWVTERLRSAGLTRIIVVAHATDAALQEHAAKVGHEVVCQTERFGIADALCRAAPLLASETAFLASACDSLFDVEDLVRMLRLAAANPKDAVVAVQLADPQASATRSAVERRGEFVWSIVEKPAADGARSSLISLPVYALPHRFLRRAAEVKPIGGERYLSTALSDEIRAGGRVRWIEFHARLEITTANDVARAERTLRKTRDA